MTEPTSHAPRLLPRMTGLTAEFYEWCRRGELRFQRCDRCGALRHVPREICPTCQAFAWSWVRSSGRGRIFTWTVVARALHPAFGNATPYAPVVVEMEEEVRLVSEVIDCPVDRLRIGLAVQVAFRTETEAVTLPVFRCA